MLKIPKQYNKGFLGAAKSTDKLPYKILCLQEITPEGRFAIPFNQAGDAADFGPVYTEKQKSEIKELALQGKVIPSGKTMLKVAGTVKTVSTAEKLGIPKYTPYKNFKHKNNIFDNLTMKEKNRHKTLLVISANINEANNYIEKEFDAHTFDIKLAILKNLFPEVKIFSKSDLPNTPKKESVEMDYWALLNSILL